METRPQQYRRNGHRDIVNMAECTNSRETSSKSRSWSWATVLSRRAERESVPVRADGGRLPEELGKRKCQRATSLRARFARLVVMNVTVEEMTQDPKGILHRVREGETLIVTEEDRPVAEIRPIEVVRRPRPFGLAAGSFVVPDDFDDPLPEDVLRDFEQ